jgi:intein/homing endonuclease
MDNKWLEDFRDNYWLGLGDASKIKTENILAKQDWDNPVEAAFNVLRQPKYFGYTSNILFGKTLAPFQQAILLELWKRPFPMLIGCRGVGKSFILAMYSMMRALFTQGSRIVICGGGFRQAKVIFDYCEEIWNSSPVYRDIFASSNGAGPYRSIDRWHFRLGESSISALPLGDGCLVGNTLVTFKDGFSTLADEYSVEHSYLLKRNRDVWSNGNWQTSDEAFVNGLRDTIRITTAKGFTLEGTLNHKIKAMHKGEIIWKRMGEIKRGDVVPIDLSRRWHDGKGEIDSQMAYDLGVSMAHSCWGTVIYERLNKREEDYSYFANITCAFMGRNNLFSLEARKEWMTKWEREPISLFPKALLNAPKESMAAFLRAIFDSDAMVLPTNKGLIVLYSAKIEFLRYIQYILTHFGILSKVVNVNRNSVSFANCKLSIDAPYIRRFLDEIGFGLHTKQQRMEKWNSQYEQDEPQDVYLDKVIETFSGEALTYDMHVPVGHEYGANGFFSHNSKIRGQRATVTIADEFACLRHDTLVETTKGLVRIGEAISDYQMPVLLQPNNAEPIKPNLFVQTKPVDVYLVTTANGYEFGCSEIHRVQSTDGWKLAKDLTPNDHLLLETSPYFPEGPDSLDYVSLDLSNGLPREILTASRKAAIGFAKYILNSCGKMTTKGIRVICKNEKLCKDLQFLLLKLGVFSTYDKNLFIEYGYAKKIVLLENETLKEHFTDAVKSVVKLPQKEILYDFSVPHSHCFLANGFIQHNTVPKDIFERVVRGFAAVSQSPVEKYQERMREEAMRSIGFYNDEVASLDEGILTTNQTVISGTAFYSFNHFYEYWQQYKSIIESRGDNKKLKEIFKGDVPAGFNWKDYSVIRLPVALLPPGFMDEKQIAQAKATVHSGTYQMEYGACLAPSVKIITDTGLKKINQIKVGDKVLTHRGRFRKVLKKTFRQFDGDICKLNTYGQLESSLITPEHPFWNGSEWEPLESLEVCTVLPCLKELNEKTEINIADYVQDFGITQCGMAYPTRPKKKLTNEQIAEIREGKKPIHELAKKFGVKRKVVEHAKRYQVRPKNSVSQIIPLSYEFGLIVGYYAAEGSIGANGRALRFTLDGHKDATLESFIDQLMTACEKVFSLTPKIYAGENDSFVNVTLNQRLLASLLKAICPGVAHTKYVKPEILYSNHDFLMGFITGYWNGDGHKRPNGEFSVACSVSLALLSQVKVALTYFNVASSLCARKKPRLNHIFNKIRKTRKSYNLSIYGVNNSLFLKRFYDISLPDNSNRHFIKSNENNCTFAIRKKEFVPYSGFVYNLEVDEDNSYSIGTGAVHNCFSTDSNGFFKRTLIESCVVGKPDSPVTHNSCGEVRFPASLRGTPGLSYIMGVDPASEHDNFSIVILELWPDHRRVVYCWTTTRAKFKNQVKSGYAEDTDFYGYVSRKIRSLCSYFNIERIALDSQGGGVAVLEALADVSRLSPGELPIHTVVTPEKPSQYDNEPGKKIIEIINFSRAEWTRDSNHFLRKDMEEKVLLFPEFDSALLALAMEEDTSKARYVDTLEDCVMEIEELKNELATIVHTQVGVSMRDRWDTPETKEAGGKKGRMRKDRYSSLLMANMTGRIFQFTPVTPEYEIVGGFAHETGRAGEDGPMWVGPAWWTAQRGQNIPGAVSRRSV